MKQYFVYFILFVVVSAQQNPNETLNEIQETPKTQETQETQEIQDIQEIQKTEKCLSDKDCSVEQKCDTGEEKCVECLDSSHCPSNWRCENSVCNIPAEYEEVKAAKIGLAILILIFVVPILTFGCCVGLIIYCIISHTRSHRMQLAARVQQGPQDKLVFRPQGTESKA